MIREIVFDTETTGFEPSEGHKIVEIGAIELLNHLPTGKNYHVYLNPERDIPAEAIAVHGITNDKVKDAPLFSQEFTNFLDFIGNDSKLIAHNASFDMKFINFELKKVGHPGIKNDRVIDSLEIARRKFPGSPANLDALCRRFEIDLSARELHGALLDAELLGSVWLELNGGRQHGLGIEKSAGNDQKSDSVQIERVFRTARTFEVDAAELEAHNALINKLNDAIWHKLKA